MSELYADIVVPLAVPAFTFRVGDALRESIAPGRCVKVQLGPNRLYTGIVWRLHEVTPPYKTIKTVEEYVPGSPDLPAADIRFWEWVAEYYMCTLGEVMRAAMPVGLKPTGLTDEEFRRSELVPRTIRYVRLHPGVSEMDKLNEAFESLKRGSRQYRALMSYVSQLPQEKLFLEGIARRLVDAEAPVINALVCKKIFEVYTVRLEQGELPPLPVTLPRLTDSQERARRDIDKGLAGGRPVLLHGVTGSGKTEIYIHLIDRCLREGRNALYLLPEIAMTSQLVARIEAYFEGRVIVYHSGISNGKRAENYRRAAAAKEGMLVMGVRSAMFMPLDNLGLVVVDEEHDDSYKQSDPAPRYNARDCALVLGRLHGAGVLLGSATPAVESYYNVLEGKYTLVTLTERYGEVPMPEVMISDTLRAVKRGERSFHFNKILLDKIGGALSRGEQVMLFQNRRGFSPYVECAECGYVPSCRDCNVSLTLHKAEGRLRCHYCGRSEPIPAVCPICGGAVETRGFGTEKVEQELGRIFPEARIVRLDRDTAQSARAFNAVIDSFGRGEADILVGTQMITKGFDFAGVSLVGMLNADNLLNYPDFRAAERAFQTMTQMAGRAGRREKRGEVVIQTSQPENVVIRQAASGDYHSMAREQLSERGDFFYPPYCRLIELTLKYRDKEVLDQAAYALAAQLRPLFGNRLLGPQPPVVDRIKRCHLLSFILKTDRKDSFAQAKRQLTQALEALGKQARFRYVEIEINVDPL